jgi:hypothetical protein
MKKIGKIYEEKGFHLNQTEYLVYIHYLIFSISYQNTISMK